MKNMLSIIFALIFKIFSIFSSIDEKRITFIMTHDDKFNGNIKYVYEYIKNNYPQYKLNIISRKDYDINIRNMNLLYIIKQVFKLYINKNYNLSKSKYVILNNIFITAAYMNFKKEVRVIQLWHAIGTFKKFGENYKPSEKIDLLQKKANSIYTDLIVCSSKDVDIYSKAFNIEKNKIHVIGSPACDLFHDKNKILKIKKKVYETYPNIQNKKIYLYAPTFRDLDEDNKRIISYVVDISNKINDDVVILLRLHPHIYKRYKIDVNKTNVVDVSKYDDVIELMLISDILITDYSSLFYEFSYLEKPIIFFPFDLEEYNRDRGFYYDYNKYVPGDTIYSVTDLIERINNSKEKVNESNEFKNYYFDYVDGKAVKRLMDILNLNDN